ncbi:MAG: YfbK domain-containing protein, partial [Bacteroidota bacterium]
MLLRNSEFKSDASFEDVLRMAAKAKGHDEEGYRSEFVRLVENAESLTKNTKSYPVDDEKKVLPLSKN